MADLTEKTRNKIPGKKFGLPKQRKYPVEDKPHARDAKSRASEMYNQGRITGAQKAEIDAKADAELGE